MLKRLIRLLTGRTAYERGYSDGFDAAWALAPHVENDDFDADGGEEGGIWASELKDGSNDIEFVPSSGRPQGSKL